jgi:hypothetical protein
MRASRIATTRALVVPGLGAAEAPNADAVYFVRLNKSAAMPLRPAVVT